MRRFNLILCFLLMLGVVLSMSACSTPEEVVTEPTVTEDPNLLVTEYALAADSPEALSALDIYPNLAKLDLRGSTCYDAILDYIAAHPQIAVTYDVLIGNTAYSQDTAEITLSEGEYEYAQLLEHLRYLSGLTSLSLPCTNLTAEELAGIAEAYPDITLSYSVMLLEEEISHDTVSLDLSNLAPEEIDLAVPVLTRLPNLAEVQLMNEDGTSTLAIADVKKLMDAAPHALVNYTFKLFGKTVTTADERLEFDRVKIKNAGVDQIREALEIMPNCTYVLMDQCSVDNDVMAQLREDFPEKNVVWRVFYGTEGYSCLTDVTVFRSVGGLTNSTSKTLKYCNKIMYMDIGHCFSLSDLSFVSYMPDLKVAIVVDCSTTSLEPFASCTNLEYLEIVNCNGVTDLSPLANCVNLKGLNMSYVFSVKDLSPLYSLQKLERLFMGRNKFSEETIAEARAALPNCWVTDHAESVAWIGFNYSVGWRLDDEHTFAEWYKEIKEIFGYTREIY